MTEAYIFDAVRTPRGKGKKDGALHSVKPVDLVAGLLKALEKRNALDTSQVDDIVLGCVTPVGDQGADIAKTAVLAAYRYAEMAAVWRPRRMEQFRRRYYLLGEAEKAMAVPVPEVDAGLVIHITPEHCDAYPVDCDQSVHRAFLFVLEAARWQFQTSKTVIGLPLQPVAKEEVA